MPYENTIPKIDNGYFKIKDFDKDSLFLNIYFWFFANYLSMYYIWRITALDHLKMNLNKKWVSILPNVKMFIELVQRKTEMINTFDFYNNSESYFEKILLLKLDLEKILKQHQLHFCLRETSSDCVACQKKICVYTI